MTSLVSHCHHQNHSQLLFLCEEKQKIFVYNRLWNDQGILLNFTLLNPLKSILLSGFCGSTKVFHHDPPPSLPPSLPQFLDEISRPSHKELSGRSSTSIHFLLLAGEKQCESKVSCLRPKSNEPQPELDPGPLDPETNGITKATSPPSKLHFKVLKT